MRDAFFSLADEAGRSLQKGESFVASYAAERSTFVRFNRGKIRQPGSVRQQQLRFELVRGTRHAPIELSLSGDAEVDRQRLSQAIGRLRERLAELPEDPHWLVHQSDSRRDSVFPSELVAAESLVDDIVGASRGLDLVGILASGEVMSGFASSFGQRHWFSRPSFNFDWSIYAHADKAVKAGYAGYRWSRAELGKKLDECRAQLDVLAKPSKKLAPGNYRVFLAPAAVQELLTILGWGGFGLKAQRTKQTPLLRLLEGEARLHPRLTLRDNLAEGAGPDFSSAGFPRPPIVELIQEGALTGALISPRSAREYDVPTNGAPDGEVPTALEMSAGDLPRAETAARLGTGLWVSNLWYLNYSDRPAGRITGMTRFATSWVENGRVVAPVDVMRFDDTIYRMLGSELEAITAERDLLLDTSTYGGRSTGSMLLPGVLLRELTLTL